MLKSICLTLLIFFVLQLTAQVDSYYLNDWYYKGNPISVSTFFYSFEYDSTENLIKTIHRKEFQVDVYDNEGNCIKHQWKDIDGTINKEFQFEYDRNGNRIEHAIFERDSILTHRYVTFFDSSNNEIGNEVYGLNNELISKNTINRFSEGLEETTITKNSTGKIVLRKVLQNDSLGRKIRLRSYCDYPKFSFSRDLEFSYNKKSKCVKEVCIFSHDDTFITEYKYDSLDREIEMRRFNKASGESQFMFRTEYIDSLNQEIRYEYQLGNLVIIRHYFRNSDECVYKEVVRKIYSTINSTIEEDQEETIFTLDKNGNWIIKTVYLNGKKTASQNRKFEYH